MGDCQNNVFRLAYDRHLKLKFLGRKVTTDAGLLAYQELDQAFGLTKMADDLLEDSRLGSNKQYRLLPLLRQSIYSRLAGPAVDSGEDQMEMSVIGACRKSYTKAG